MAPMAIPEGYDFLPGRTREKAREALALAAERGLAEETVLSRTDGFLIPLGGDETAVSEPVEIEFPDPEKDSHAVIDDWAANFSADLGGPISFEGIAAENAEKPTKAEKVAHLQKVVAERAAENDAAAGEEG